MSSHSQSFEREETDNVTRCLQWRQTDIFKRENVKRTLENAAEDNYVNKDALEERYCQIPGEPKSSFLMVFSPDGTKVASTHGNHNIYVSELASGKHVKELTGHPRTPWCITFHPSRPRLLASGCLGGQIRVWDLDGGSEVWSVENEVASIAFHPHDQMLVIATMNELHFWDWKYPRPNMRIRTNSIKEKVRFVAFDAFGHKLITGISINRSHAASVLNSNSVRFLSNNNNNINNNNDPENNPENIQRTNRNDRVNQIYEGLFQSYDNLMNQYRQLMAEGPIPANTIDRGTDPMDVDQVQYFSHIRGPIPRPPQPVVVRRIPLYVHQQYYSRNVNRPNRSNQESPNDDYLPMHSFPQPPTVELRENNLENPQPANRENSDSVSVNSIINQMQSSLRDQFGIHIINNVPQPESDNNSESRLRSERSEPVLADRTAELNSRSNANISVEVDPNMNRDAQNLGSVQMQSDSNVDDEDDGEAAVFHSETFRPSHQSAFSQVHNPSNSRQEEPTPPPPLPESHRLTREFHDGIMERARSELTASLNLQQIHGFMENSIDDTLNYLDRYGNGSRPSFLDIMREIPIRRTNTNMVASPNSNTSADNNASPSDTGSSARTSTLERINRLRNLVNTQIEEEFRRDLVLNEIRRSLIRSGNRLNNLINGSNQVPLNDVLNEADRDNLLISSDDDSDGDRDLYIPILSRNSSESSTSARSVPLLFSRVYPLRVTDPRQRYRENNDHQYYVRNGSGPSSSFGSNPTRDHQYCANQYSNPNVRRNPARNPNLQTTRNDIRNPYLNMNRNNPSTSRSTADSLPGSSRQSDEDNPSFEDQETSASFQKVTIAIKLLERHTENLATLLSRNQSRPPIEQLRQLWEQLNTGMVTLDNSPREAIPDLSREYMSQPLLSDLEVEPQADQNPGPSSSPNDDSVPSTSSGIRHEKTNQPKTYPPSKKSPSRRTGNSPYLRKKIHALILNAMSRNNYMKWQNILQSERRRSNRNVIEIPKPNHIENTRSAIRILARNILSVMFNMMMRCLEVEQLGNMIVVMLRSLKKSLSITCVLLIPNSAQSNPTTPNDNASENNESEEDYEMEDSSRINSSELAESSNLIGVTPEWSDRVAIQISAANRNDSSTATHRREAYNNMCSSRRTSLLKSNLHQTKKHALKKGKRLKVNSSRPSTSRQQPTAPTREMPSTSLGPRIPPTSNAPSTSGVRIPPPVFSLPSVHRPVQFRYVRRSHSPVLPRHASPLLSPTHAERIREVHNVRRFLFVREQRLNSRRNAISHFSRFFPRTSNNVVVPSVRVNDVPVNDMNQHPAPEGGSRLPGPRVAEFHPVFVPNLGLGDENIGIGFIDPGIHHIETPPMSRIQVWNFSEGEVPDIRNVTKNVVVAQCKILNDASVDISKDGQLLVALVPSPHSGGFNSTRLVSHCVGIYSLDWNNLGDCLYYTLLEQTPVSVSLSPCARHLAVGFSTTRFTTIQAYARSGIMALIFRLGNKKRKDVEGSGGLIPVRTLEQGSDSVLTSLNCLRWAPQPGQGLICANNKGQLKVLS